MTLMLASVRGPEEAEAAVTLGADIVDLNDAADGALTPGVVQAVVRTIAGRRPTSVATADPLMEPETIVAAVAAMAATGVQYVKVGLFPHARREKCIGALATLARRTRLVGVMFADLETETNTRRAVIEAIRAAGFAGAALETTGSGSGRLLDLAHMPSLADFIETCHANSLLAGLAGALEPPDISRLLPLAPDYVGFRTALCVGGDRTAPLDPVAFRLVRELIPPTSSRDAGASEASVDYRLVAVRGSSVDAGRDEAARNRIFVRDFVLPIRVGTYAHERDKLQRVRFNVDVEVLRPLHPTEDMRDVLSYDLITDGIRMIVAREHIALLETLAEQIAALALAHPWASAATVRVEKLDVESGSVGVEVRRERPAEMANVRKLYPAATGGGDKAGR
jgi:FolB domain-containing protein